MAGVQKHMAPNMQLGLSRTLEVWRNEQLIQHRLKIWVLALYTQFSELNMNVALLI